MALTDLTLRLPDLEAPSATGASWTNPYPYPSFELPSGTVTVRTNGVKNPALAVNSTGWSWSGAGLGTPARVAGAGVGGSAGFVATCIGALNAGGDGLQVGDGADHISVTPLAFVYPSIYIKSSRASRFTIRYAFYTAGGVIVGSGQNSASAERQVAADTHVRLQDTAGIVVPATATRMLIRAVPIAGTGYNAIVSGDVLTVSKASTAPGDYFDGNTPDAGDFEYVWSGTANASTSIMRAKGLPSVYGATGERIVFQSQEWADEGVSSLRLKAGAAASTSVYGAVVIAPAAITFGSLGYADGDVVTLVAKCRLVSPQTGTIADGARSIMHGTPGASPTFAQAPNEAGVHEVRLTTTIVDAATDFIRLTHGADFTNDDIWWDMFTIVSGAYTGPPFTGSSDITGYETAWLGAINESASTLTELIPGSPPIREVVSWSVTEPGTPHNISSSGGSTGTASVTVKAHGDSYWSISEPVDVTVAGVSGSLIGTVDSVQVNPFAEHGEPGGSVTLGLASVLNLLNAERTLAPIIEEPLSAVFSQYVAAVTPLLSVTWLATSDPIRTYGAWSGNVWSILKTLCAANRVEIALNGGQMIVRDLGTRVFRLDGPAQPGLDIENVAVSVSPGSGQFVEIIYRDARAIDNQAAYNYAENPSVEVNATGWDARTTAWGAIVGSRVTN